MKNKIVVIGSSNTDMVIKSREFPQPGETILGSDFFINQGGKGANQAVAAARLGGDVSFVAKVGDDVFGNEALGQFKKDGINCDYVGKDSKNPTGVALITVNHQAENTIIVAAGANLNLTSEDVLNAKEEILAADLILMQLEIPLETVAFAKQFALENGKKVILNPAPAAKLDDDLLRDLFLLTPNKTETEILTGIKITTDDDIEKAAQTLLSKGVKNIIITLGSKGSYFLSADHSAFIKAQPVKAIDTTAAGDVFNGALAVAITNGKSMEDAIHFASKASAFSVTKAGAQASAPTLKDLFSNF